ncbi:MAG: cysteine-rich repeat protein [Bradymonadia bacterium]|jgi:cysteine-rich repeat protein
MRVRQGISRVLGVVALAALLGGCDDGVSGEADGFVGCGDGIVGPSEQCDDGDAVDGDGCSALCLLETAPACGDGTVDADEDCDDGNTDDGDGCSSTCTTETAPACGDGTVDDGEECDDGNTDGGDGCAADCTTEPVPFCGDGTVDDGEECDDGNTDADDGCDADCALEPFCGDGTVDDGEECDDGNLDADDGCDADCVIEPFCGDGTVDDGEACDDGNADAGDGCDADCAIEAVCGDSNLEGDEECDDGGTDAGDGCAADCTFEPAVCGDAILQNGEECDDGNVDAADGCSAACLDEIECLAIEDCVADEFCARGYCLDELPPVVCGDSLVEGDEECDDGNLDNGDLCDDQCVIPDPICGNGFVEEGEQCDDGNLDIDDGCNADCVIEICGNGLIETGEECDDGNLDAGDFCDADCVIEPGCGNGRLEDDENCDDGNADAGDGCDALCVIEPGFVFPLAPLDACVQLGGEIDDMDAGWDRPGEFGNECAAGDGDNHFYEVFRFTNDGALPQYIDLTANWAGDGFVHIFNDPFVGDMLDLENGCLGGDDDFNGAGASQVADFLVAPGQTIVVVASTFRRDEAIGRYTVDVCTVPPPVLCGDGMVQEDNGEECDDGNVDAGDGCDDRCQREEVCGDGLIDGLEECDDGNIDPADGCDALCQREPVCGDTFVDAPEQCDDGNADAGDGCSDVCLFESECGDGILEGLEQCDVGPDVDGDGCDAQCNVEQPDALDIADRGETISIEGALEEGDLTWNRPSAGCGFASPDRVYDFYRVTNNTGADQRITVTGAWGADSYLHIFRDPFNPADPGGCVIGNDDFNGFLGSQVRDVEIADGETLVIVASSYDANAFTGPYTLEVLTQPVCGDGAVNGDEACDDGNLDNGDGCNDACQVEAVCGDGERGLGEECDDGNLDAGDGCDAVCAIERICGNGLTTNDEECDDGNLDNGDGCDESCDIEPFCGDGDVDDGEECDDGNVDAGDGCDAGCVIERVCGDGLLTDDEQCDDGNVDAGDGCDADCALEEGPFAIAPRDQAINAAGDIDDMDLVWSRPNGDCSARAGDQFFETLTIVNNTGADQAVRVTANWAADGYLFVYRAPFDPANLDNCVIGNDDFNGLRGSRIESVDIADGEQLVIVATSFGDNNAIGPYDIEVYTLPVIGGDVVEVGIVDFAMDPNDLVINVGDTVRWTNQDAAAHTVTSSDPGSADAGEMFDSGNMAQGDTFEFTFNEAGQFTYFCRPHSGFMRDYTVTVNDAP